ncbi:hypothetical protein KN825_16600, partial [Weizmannia coagulans]|nr:hypothetical protein [Heyndrickxia coagulans]
MERKFFYKRTSGSKINLEEIQDPQNSIQLPMDTQIQQTVVDTTLPAQVLRRSDRMRHELERYGFLVTDDHDVLLVDQNEPTTYQEAMSDPNS